MTSQTHSSNKIRSSTSRKVFVGFNTVFFVLFSFLCFYPFWYVFIQSISDGTRAINAIIVPVGPTLQNYAEVLQMPAILQAFLVSVARTAIGTVTTVLCCMYAGYLFTKTEMPFRKFCYRLMVITMYVSGGLIPSFLVMKSYGMMNSFAVYIIPSLFGAYNIILMKTYVEQLPAELEESARIDGASTMRVLCSIIIPLSVPIIATIAIYASNGHWNSWFDTQLYNINTKSLATLQFLLYRYLNQSEQLLKEMEERGATSAQIAAIMTPRGVKMTVTMISIIPIISVYPFMQRYLIKGIMVGAIKG